METDIDRGLSAEAAVEKEQSTARARLEQATDAYMRDRLHDLDDLSNRLLRILTGQVKKRVPICPLINPDCINIGPAELLDWRAQPKGYRSGRGICGEPRNHRGPGLAIPLVIRAKNITTEALNGDRILRMAIRGLCTCAPMKWLPMPFVIKSRWRPKLRTLQRNP